MTLAVGMSLAGLLALPVQAGDCIGRIVGVQPILRYDHSRGEGYLAVRSGPGSGFEQVGEVYRGDEVAVHAREGNWFAVQCFGGQCLEPLWGAPRPQGWVYGRFLRVSGTCP